mmetsp:Transcript_158558/g.279991  ORF Transcript_158558/g.279991 Transcript_158558/m.279991 type:complete len:413 (+) Transcript_158558:99-1337(+)
MAPVAALPPDSFSLVIDISSPEELFEHDGPLLAEDTDWYWFAKDDMHEAGGGGGLKRHIDRVMEQIKVRKECEVRTRIDSAVRTAVQRTAPQWDAHVDCEQVDEAKPATEEAAQAEVAELMKATMESLEAARQRMELRARAAAAIQAATSRASADTVSEETNSTSTLLQPERTKAAAEKRSQHSKPAREAGERPVHVRSVQANSVQWQQRRVQPPPPPSHPAPGVSRLRAEALIQHRLQDRINQIVAQAHSRNKAGVIDFSEAATTASNHSALDSAESSSESGTESLHRPWPSDRGIESVQSSWPADHGAGSRQRPWSADYGTEPMQQSWSTDCRAEAVQKHWRTDPGIEARQRSWAADRNMEAMQMHWPTEHGIEAMQRHWQAECGVEPMQRSWSNDPMHTNWPGFHDMQW